MRRPPTASVDDLLAGLADRGQLVHVEHVPPRRARYANLARALPDEVVGRRPAPRLWTHQAEAIDLARDGHDVAVATGTASGKSLCYQVPIAEAVLVGGATALLVFPTKALAQDQLRSIAALDVPGLVAATYDGDTDTSTRAWVRRHATVVLTNPDMLHVGILPNHARWAPFLARLRYVVLDELHTLRGVFGTHVGHVIRRLRRTCARYGSDPTFILGSATIGDAGGLAAAVIGRPVRAVTDDGSPQGARTIAVWEPPLLDEAEGTRASATGEAAALLAGLVSAGRRTITFTRSRRAAEVIAANARRRLPDDLAGRVRPYRGGYLPAERRAIEAELFDGRLLGVSATTALELGVDVGSLDACVVHGFPGTIASFRQQIGRVGRARQESLAVLVAGDDALDQCGRAPRARPARHGS